MDEDEEIVFDIGISNDSNKLSKEKSIVLGATCISIVCKMIRCFYIDLNTFS